jgi:hypothetical protein
MKLRQKKGGVGFLTQGRCSGRLGKASGGSRAWAAWQARLTGELGGGGSSARGGLWVKEMRQGVGAGACEAQEELGSRRLREGRGDVGRLPRRAYVPGGGAVPREGEGGAG